LEGTWKEGFFTGNLKGYLQEGSGNGHLSIGDPLEAGGGGYSTGNFERKAGYCFVGINLIIRDCEKYVKGGLGNGQLSPFGSR